MKLRLCFHSNDAIVLVSPDSFPLTGRQVQERSRRDWALAGASLPSRSCDDARLRTLLKCAVLNGLSKPLLDKYCSCVLEADKHSTLKTAQDVAPGRPIAATVAIPAQLQIRANARKIKSFDPHEGPERNQSASEQAKHTHTRCSSGIGIAHVQATHPYAAPSSLPIVVPKMV